MHEMLPRDQLKILPADAIIKDATPFCKLCAQPNKHDIDMALLKGTSTKNEVCAVYDVSPDEVDLHLRHHVAGLSPKHLDNKDWLYNKALQLDEIIVMLTEQIKARGEIDTREVRALAGALGELRQEIRVLAEIEGQLAQKPNITIQQFNTLKLVVLQDLCPQCQRKVMTKIRALADTP